MERVDWDDPTLWTYSLAEEAFVYLDGRPKERSEGNAPPFLASAAVMELTGCVFERRAGRSRDAGGGGGVVSASEAMNARLSDF